MTVDRAPTSREMTLAYWKAKVDVRKLISGEAVTIASRKADRIRLVKRTCQKLEERRYECRATVMKNDMPVDGYKDAEDAIFTHVYKGWEFKEIVHQ